ncbi:hypothetical protein N657DRAFT_439652 [Parathielavia appendiculata]|uniref:FeS cluster biogenesis domain-containing protein n=1 Tax=Parathielavia appendiculata TaxID=2587402 RepID=A0AAN6U0I4_9PEZI|nr:hypothetical protein N657DRAFT_439652 [Parathielavia appendiculata]
MSRLRCSNAPTTAGLFVQLSMRRQLHPTGLPILDILLPFRRLAAGAPAVRAYGVVSTTRPAEARHPAPSPTTFLNNKQWASATPHIHHPTKTKARSIPVCRPIRLFSTSRPWRATHAIFNPQKDDGGKEMMLEITPRAAKRLTEIMTRDSNPHLALRIQVESGGCHGFQYLMKLVTLPAALPTKKDSPATPAAAEDDDNASATIHEDDTVFTYTAEEDSSSPPADLTGAPKIILDQPSLELLKGSKVDFTVELIGSQFKIVDNPLATSSCGCGTSFDIKI